MARDAKLMVRMSEQVLEKVRVEAEMRGITMSALAAFVIGEWLTQQDRVRPMIESFAAQLAEMTKEAAIEPVKGAF